MRHGRFRLAKQTGSSAHFAVVALTATPAPVDDFSVEASPAAIRGWREPVRLGVEEGLKIVSSLGQRPPMHIAITEFIGVPTDTSDQDAKIAALLATLSAFVDQDRMPTIYFSKEDDAWVLRWSNDSGFQ